MDRFCHCFSTQATAASFAYWAKCGTHEPGLFQMVFLSLWLPLPWTLVVWFWRDTIHFKFCTLFVLIAGTGFMNKTAVWCCDFYVGWFKGFPCPTSGHTQGFSGYHRTSGNGDWICTDVTVLFLPCSNKVQCARWALDSCPFLTWWESKNWMGVCIEWKIIGFKPIKNAKCLIAQCFSNLAKFFSNHVHCRTRGLIDWAPWTEAVTIHVRHELFPACGWWRW